MILYKYVRPERIDILRECIIRFTPPMRFNDPLEFEPSITQLVTSDQMLQMASSVSDEDLMIAFEKEMPEELKGMVNFEMVKPLLRAHLPQAAQLLMQGMPNLTSSARAAMVKIMNEQVGVLALSEVNNSLLMWAHYSYSHEGFVIGFNSESSWFDMKRSSHDELRHLRKVVYSSNRPSGPLLTFNGVDLFLTKSFEWEYEQEWRIMRELEDADQVVTNGNDIIHLFNFPNEIITEIIIGCRATDKLQNEIRQLTESSGPLNHVRILKAEVNDIEFKLDFVEVE